MRDKPRLIFVPAECSLEHCRDRECPYSHFEAWALEGVEGFFDSATEALSYHCVTNDQENPLK